MSRIYLVGLLAGCASALVGAGWQIMTRQSAMSAIAPLDLAMLRYWIPALVLAPLAWRQGLRPAGLPWPLLLVLVVGGGLPFGLLAMTGAKFAPAAHMGVLVPGAAPLLAAGIAWLLSRETPSRGRAAGLACMGLSVVVLGARAWADDGAAGTWRGDALFLVAAFVWAAFTLALRRSGLGPLHAAALINTWSALLLLPWFAVHGAPTIASLPWPELAIHALWQGVLAGLLGFLMFAVAVARLGPGQAAAVGALVPMVSAVGGWWWLGEQLSAAEWLAAAGVTLGVLLASGVLDRRAK
jgi:drug/metabolite transporter (DMT)-like permease